MFGTKIARLRVTSAELKTKKVESEMWKGELKGQNVENKRWKVFRSRATRHRSGFADR
jgi:hypothetical protein